ncbi:MAG TPA: class I SAM-dependent methyltransferase [Stellaceae bacterium]|nr:class I SAM-dependent methyltransferase [Stellaceae bacterium]
MQVLAQGLAGEWQGTAPTAVDMRRSYDRYYETGLYDSRYPRPNPHMLDLILRELGETRGRVLDFGCGSGRYALPLAHRPGVSVFGYDVSAAAIHELRRRMARARASGAVGGQLDLLCGSFAELERRLGDDRGFDLVMLLFGVLGHIQSRRQRISMLRSLRARLRPGGRLILTVPNRARRFRLEQRQAAANAALESGDIRYSRGGGSGAIELYYHLYTLPEFTGELAEAGFAVRRLEAESVLPERAVLTSPVGARLDKALRAVTPLSLAYGFVAVAEPAPTHGLG